MIPGIIGLGEHRPARLVSNVELAATGLAIDEAWMASRTGIKTRRIAGDGEGVVEMATAAAQKALADAGVTADAIDLLLLASCSLPITIPGGAAAVAHNLGSRAGALDINGACAGFCYGLGLASSTITSGQAGTVLVVAAERMSDVVDWTDRGVCVLFGDGAGAALVGKVPALAPGGLLASPIGPTVWSSEGSGADAILQDATSRHISMKGSAVYRWATSLAALGEQACAAAGIRPDQLAAFIPHQANARIIDALANTLLGPARDHVVVAKDVEDSANTSAASVPLALSRLRAEGRVQPGDPALLMAFGAGLTSAAQVIAVP